MFRGERVELDLSSAEPARRAPLLGDIVERQRPVGPPAPPVRAPANTSGFPAPRRLRRQKEQKQEHAQAALYRHENKGVPEDGIERESLARLAAMTEDEITRERQELTAQLDPKLVEKLRQRALRKAEERGGPAAQGRGDDGRERERTDAAENMLASESTPAENADTASASQVRYEPRDTAESAPTYEEAMKASAQIKVHFPAAPKSGSASSPTLDPASDSFLQELHDKYYPDLQHDVSRLAWMQPISDTEDREQYHPDMADVAPSAVRFDFAGHILPPRKSRLVSPHEGLHHHADAPAAAGYTIPELAHLARSRFPAQRAMAIRTLGRVLYGIGVSRYGEEVSSLVRGLVDEFRVIDSLMEAADEGATPHVGVRSHATEALWLWQQGKQGPRSTD